jgi:methylthioribose-1-phosphate isomerase
VIEERDPDEVRLVRNALRVVASSVSVWNPAFDITPAELVRAIVTERGVLRPPYNKALEGAASRDQRLPNSLAQARRRGGRW